MQKVSVAYGEGDSCSLNSLLTNGVLISGIVALIVLALGMLVTPFLFTILNIQKAQELTILVDSYVLAVVGTSLMIFAYGLGAFNQGLQSSLGIGLLFATISIISLLFTIVLLYWGYGLLALPLAILFRGVSYNIGNIIYLIWRCRQENLRFKFSTKGFRELTSLLSYTFFGRIASILANNIDALLITRYLGSELVPVYALTRKAPDISRTFLERPSVAFMPAIASLYATGNLYRTRSILMRLICIISWMTGLACIGFILLNETFVRLWVGQALYAGTNVNLVIIMDLVVLIFTNMLSNICYALGNIKGNSIAMIVQGLISIPLMIFCVKLFGILGVALATLISAISISIWYYPWIFIRLLKIEKGEVKKILREFVWVGLAGLTTWMIVMRIDEHSWIRVDAHSWLAFVQAAIAISLFYIANLILLSKMFREECVQVTRRISLKGRCHS